ncbi:MAG: hypothetical protein HZC24_14690 [Rhodocyclales bacterium]|nr:hypothetical protein [Rhodocyclales bacterium]
MSLVASIADAYGRPLRVAQTVLLVLLLAGSVGMLGSLAALRGDAAALEAKIKQSTQARQALREEIAAIEEQLKTLPPPADAGAAAGATSAPPPAAVPQRPRAVPPPQLVKVRADLSKKTCIFRPGYGGALADCLRAATKI